MMRCHICLPDWQVLEIEVEQKATGQQCLDKVRDLANHRGGEETLFEALGTLSGAVDL